MINSRPHLPRILFICRSYWPDSEADGKMLTSLCENLTGEFEIEVITGRPKHCQERFNPSTVGVVRRRGVTIQRVLNTRFPQSSRAGRLFNSITFLASAFLATLWRSPPPDLIVTQTDPFLIPLLGRFVHWRYKVPFIVSLLDVYPNSGIFQKETRKDWLTSWLRRRAIASCNHADKVIVPGDEIRLRCVENGMSESLLQVISPWASCKEICPLKDKNSFRNANHLEDRFVVMLSERLDQSRSWMTALEAATALRQEQKIVFVFTGDSLQNVELLRLVRERGLQNVHFAFDQIETFPGDAWSGADVLVLSNPVTARSSRLPGELPRILAAGTAILSLNSTGSEISRLVDREEIGVVCDPKPAHTLITRLTETIRRMASDIEPIRLQGSRARQLCLEQFSQTRQVERIKTLFIESLQSRRVPVLIKKVVKEKAVQQPLNTLNTVLSAMKHSGSRIGHR